MVRITPRRIPHDVIMKFVTIEKGDNLRIQFDFLCKYLVQHEARKFLPSDFENHFNKEMTKLKGYVVDQVLLTKVCNYIDDLSLYLTRQSVDAQKGDLTGQIKEFQTKHSDVYERARLNYLRAMEVAKKNDPERYKLMLAKYNRRYGDASKRRT